jgi:spoIIIJ-associated protein
METTLHEIVESLLKGAKITFTEIQISLREENEYYVNVVAQEDGGLLIGYHGETLRSLEILVNALLKARELNARVFFDAESYRRNQEKNILELAERKAKKVLETGDEDVLPPMSPYNRRLVHLMFMERASEFPGIKTLSTGEGDMRQVRLFKGTE